jgi:hypothetical protein
MAHKHELAPPPDAIANDEAKEFLRAWAVNDGIHVSLLPQAWRHPAAWGIILADIVRHVADGYHQADGRDKAKAMQEIMALLIAEFQAPTNKKSTASFVKE